MLQGGMTQSISLKTHQIFSKLIKFKTPHIHKSNHSPEDHVILIIGRENFNQSISMVSQYLNQPIYLFICVVKLL